MSESPRLFSYVVDHDDGLSPNPNGGYCTLAFCKYSKSERGNVVELAQVGDWVVGTSGLGPRSVGEHGRLIYAMRVTEKLTLREYFRDPRFANRAGNEYDLANSTDRFALVSDHFFYFGQSAPKIPTRFVNHHKHRIEKRGRGFRNRFPDDFITAFTSRGREVARVPLASVANEIVARLAAPAWEQWTVSDGVGLLAYADWLAEQGESRWAERIRQWAVIALDASAVEEK